jgi:hypothetical protein
LPLVVQSLQNNQDRLFLLREEALLKLQQLGTVFLTGGGYLRALDSQVIAGVNIGETDLAVPGASLEHCPSGISLPLSLQFSRARSRTRPYISHLAPAFIAAG